MEMGNKNKRGHCRDGYKTRPYKSKNPAVLLQRGWVFNLAMPYSHMGKPHTTIGITAFYF